MNEPTTAGLLLHDNDDDAVAAAAAGDDDEGVGGGGWSSRAVTPASAGGSSSKKTFQRLWVFLYSRGSLCLSVLVFGGRCYFGPVAFLILIRHRKPGRLPPLFLSVPSPSQSRALGELPQTPLENGTYLEKP